jgi:hypothetical protein
MQTIFYRIQNRTYQRGVFLLLFLSVISACSKSKQVEDKIEIQQQSIPLRVQNLYKINQYTGDSIEQHDINIKFGIPYQIEPKLVSLDSLPNQKIIPLENKQSFAFSTNKIKLKRQAVSIPFNEQQVKYIFPAEEVTSYWILEDGDSIKTGVPFPFQAE